MRWLDWITTCCREPEIIPQPEEYTREFISKDALLSWTIEKINSTRHYRERAVYEALIEKIKSM